MRSDPVGVHAESGSGGEGKLALVTPPALLPPEDGGLGDPAPSQLGGTPEPQPITGR